MSEPKNEFERIAEASEQAQGEGRSLYSQPDMRKPMDVYIAGKALYFIIALCFAGLVALAKALGG